MSSSIEDADMSIPGSTRNCDSTGDVEENTLSFNDSDFYLNMDDVDIGPQIGQGAFSKVYLGRYLGELVAVKKQARKEADLEAYLMRELAVLKHFQHDNLLQYVGASNAASVEPGGLGHVFIVTELACGGDLLALLLSDGEVGWKLRVSILTDAARALEFLHRKSLIHRDIKSPNILLDSNHRCKIADFGMARQLGANMTVVGTDAYMAPELMFDNPYGTSADMFSFGIVLWEAIYRQKAGADEFIERRMSDRFEVDVQALQEDAPPDTSASLVALAAQLVENEPDQRPTAEDTLLWLEDLTDALPEDIVEPRAPIDYESLFPVETGDRESQRMAHVKNMSARARAAASSTPPQGEDSRSGGGGGGCGGGASSGSSPLPPSVPSLARRATVGPVGTVAVPVVVSNQEVRGGASVKRTKSLQGGLRGAHGGGGGGGGGSGGGGGANGRMDQVGVRLGGSPRASWGNSNLGHGGTAGSSSSLTSTYLSGGAGGHRAIGASHAPITRQGYLYKKGKSGLKNWQKRWFVLEGSKLIWYKDSRSYPREPRGYLELRGCFLVKGTSHRWKILSADAAAEQDDYNREVGAKTVKEMESWMKCLQEAIDGADTGEGPAGVMLPVLKGEEEELDRHLFHGATGSYRADLSVESWLNSLGLGSLAGAFSAAGYTDFLVIQEMGLTDEDLSYVGVKSPVQRKILKMGAKGLVEFMLQVDISGFFNFNSELVYRVDSKWRYLRATTFFEFSDFEDLHRRLRMAMKETKFYKMMPPLPQRPNSKKIGTNDHAGQMARLQQELNSYMQKLVMLVGTKEPYFTVLCGMLDLLPPDPSRLPVRTDDFLAQMQTRVIRRGGGGGRGGAGGLNGGKPAKPAKPAKQGSFSSSSSFRGLKKQVSGGVGSSGSGNGGSRPRSLESSGRRKTRLSSGSSSRSLGMGGGDVSCASTTAA